MCSTLKGNRYITLMLTLLFFGLRHIITNLKQRKFYNKQVRSNFNLNFNFAYNTNFVWCVYT